MSFRFGGHIVPAHFIRDTSMIIVCGEALMDVFGGAESPTGVALDARVGGSPFNVAVGLARLGQRVGYFGSLSRDFLGQRLLRALREEGVDTAPVVPVDAPTTLGLVGADARGVPSYAFYGHGGADRQLVAADLDAFMQQHAKGMTALHLGSFALVVPPIADTLHALVQRLPAGTLVSHDPNIRLNVEPDLARWRASLDALLPRTHLLKISDEDLALLWPGLAPQAFCEQALQRGVRLVVVTGGAQGAIGRTAAASVEVPAVTVKTVDTVGAGDTFQAALLTWLAERGALAPEALAALDADALRSGLAFAARAAAITCSRRGADLPRRAELG